MLDSLLTSPTTKMLEQTVNFTERRHEVLLDNIANISTPGFVPKDLSVEQFQASLRQAMRRQQQAFNEPFEPESTEEVTFVPGSSAIRVKPSENPNGMGFHDRGIRNMEYLMSQVAENAYGHNIAAQFLKNRYDQIARAITMKV